MRNRAIKAAAGFAIAGATMLCVASPAYAASSSIAKSGDRSVQNSLLAVKKLQNLEGSQSPEEILAIVQGSGPAQILYNRSGVAVAAYRETEQLPAVAPLTLP